MCEWNSVHAKLPEDGEIVLTGKNGIFEVMRYEKRRNGWLRNGMFWSMGNVTHWMPIPRMPK